ncbi:MAG: glycogen debranching enzyme family protein [Gemmatimonadetes bacterium]|nr:glycogen debranching enzyme family protein [Gemmatimonadota bacterium]
MDDPIRRLSWPPGDPPDPARLLQDEWLVTNGLGGYAACTLAGVPTRRYHALLVAALGGRFGRTVMLAHVDERIEWDGGAMALTALDRGETADPAPAAASLREFRLETGLPVWVYALGGRVVERRIVMPARQNTTLLLYRLLSGRTLRLRARPWVHLRSHDAEVSSALHAPYRHTTVEARHEIASAADYPPLRLEILGAPPAFIADARVVEDVHYRLEELRGYPSVGPLWSPGVFSAELTPYTTLCFLASSEDWGIAEALTPDEAIDAERERRRRLVALAASAAQTGPAAELVLAADQFVIRPVGRRLETPRIEAVGDEVRTIIAGYPWFTDWGRDTMIGLEGLALCTGRAIEAGYILRTFAHYIRNGLIPNLFPEGQSAGLYNTADATLWFFHAIDRYVRATGDHYTLELLLPRLKDILNRHIAGTDFGIRLDPADGLVIQGAEGYQLTWMDAKVDDWVVTPRRGKSVEINALWYNALRLMEGWLRERGDEEADGARELAERCRLSFNRRFWYDEGGYLYDVVDGPEGDDPKCRPNQVLAISLEHPVLDPARWVDVLRMVREKLLTPVGLRSLAPGDPDYKPTYFGDRRARDAAYHQGTVWPWLIGPFVDAWLRVHPGDVQTAHGWLDGLIDSLGHDCIGTISEIFDAEPPYTSRGCVAQAWSVAETLRALLRTTSG